MTPRFHALTGGPYKQGYDWGALIRMLDEDYRAIRAGALPIPEVAAPVAGSS